MLGRYQQFSYIVSVINRQIQKIERDEMEKYGYKGSFAQYLMATELQCRAYLPLSPESAFY